MKDINSFADLVFEQISTALSHRSIGPLDPISGPIDEIAVRNILTNHYMSYEYMSTLSELFKMILSSHVRSTPSGNAVARLDNSILEILSSFRLASLVASAEGYAIFADFKTVRDMLVIKTSRDSKGDRDILFEYFTGMVGLNTLRKYTPNFVYTLGVFRCNPLNVVDNLINYSNICGADSSQYYVIYEKIPGMTLHAYIKNLDFNKPDNVLEIFNVVVQMCLSLRIAQQRIGFVHYDLHTQNVMIRKLDHPIDIPYIIGDYQYTIRTRIIATVIDYGFTHWHYKGTPLCIKRFNSLGIVPTSTPIGYDIYKLCMYIMLDITESHYRETSQFSWILEYFASVHDLYGIHTSYSKGNDDEFKSKIDIGSQNFYSTTQSSPLYDLDPIKFVNWIHSNKCVSFNKICTLSVVLIIDSQIDLIQMSHAVRAVTQTYSTARNKLKCPVVVELKSAIFINYARNILVNVLDDYNTTDQDKILRQINAIEELKKDKDGVLLTVQSDQRLITLLIDRLTRLISSGTVQPSMPVNMVDIVVCDNYAEYVQRYIIVYNTYIKLSEYYIDSPMPISSRFTSYYLTYTRWMYTYTRARASIVFSSINAGIDMIQLLKTSIVVRDVKTTNTSLLNFYASLLYASRCISGQRDTVNKITPALYDLIYKMTIATPPNKKSDIEYAPSESNIQLYIAYLNIGNRLTQIFQRYVRDTVFVKSDYIGGDNNIYKIICKQIGKQTARLNPPSYFGISHLYDYLNMGWVSVKDRPLLRYLDIGVEDISTDIKKMLNVDVTHINVDDIMYLQQGTVFDIVSLRMVSSQISDIDLIIKRLRRMMITGSLLVVIDYRVGCESDRLCSDIDTNLRRISHDPRASVNGVYSNYPITTISSLLQLNSFTQTELQYDNSSTTPLYYMIYVLKN